VTGLAVAGDNVYVGSRTQNRTFVYNLPNLTGRVGATPYGGGSLTNDIERNPDGRIWVASERTDMPLCLLSSEGRVESVIDVGLVPAATGVALDDEGFLWVSVPGEGLIRLDVAELAE
jgi:hypothetical protein